MPKPTPYPDGWRVNFWHEGRRYQRRFSFDKYDNPKRAAIDFINSIVIGQHSEATIPETIDVYLSNMLSTRQKRESTIKNDRQRLNQFAGWAAAGNSMRRRFVD